MPLAAHVERARRHRQRVVVRAWEQRQLFTSKGVWWRLARLLAYSERGFSIDLATSLELERRGSPPPAVGLELSPPLRIHVLAADRAEEVPRLEELVLRPSRELFTAGQLVLVPFDGADQIPPPPDWLRG